MADYVSVFTYNDKVSLSFAAEDPKVMSLGENWRPSPRRMRPGRSGLRSSSAL
ncbi:hypothetical protein C816_03343 [Oscillibacter sp. 1-3]|nr:hypothetical protein C816_03343 [Oscillibacter sp. 1-3]